VDFVTVLLLSFNIFIEARGGATGRGGGERLAVGVGAAGRAGAAGCDVDRAMAVTGVAARHELSGAGGRSQGFREKTY
jgi:hypothetical protein